MKIGFGGKAMRVKPEVRKLVRPAKRLKVRLFMEATEIGTGKTVGWTCMDQPDFAAFHAPIPAASLTDVRVKSRKTIG